MFDRLDSVQIAVLLALLLLKCVGSAIFDYIYRELLDGIFLLTLQNMAD